MYPAICTLVTNNLDFKTITSPGYITSHLFIACTHAARLSSEQNETIRRAYLHENKMRLLDGRIYIRTKWDY